ncbi:HAD-IC family P-type ATPase [Patescibacteria group bacterium]|nr:HAD-IC family P-type ATPase [Patescibacteria group bacterium]MBU4023452.1 HAD-IC family P-type ATPase [Patescibacteria group bacterium]MBU4078050.1 HAD-IC family P-type ATPase [Patescibacteria group bacterium]
MINHWHNLSWQKTIDFLCTDKDFGLDDREVHKRQSENGRNVLPKEQPMSKIKILLGQMKSPLIYILIIAGIVVIFFGDFADGAVIMAAVIVNTTIGFIQENKASKSLAELKKIIRHKAKVIRNNGIKLIDSSDIVSGDIFLLKAGDMVPADGRIIESENLKINEMALTGEWLPTEKHSEDIDIKTPLADRDNMVYTGTIVEYGKAKVVVTTIGVETELGKIALIVSESKEGKTPYQKKLSKFSKIIGIFIAIASIFIFIKGILTGGDILEMFITSVAVAIAAIPEGLPVAMTVILAIGMQKILKKKGLVRKLVAAETLGSTSVICTDKTATLTQGKIKLTKIISHTEDESLLYTAMALCNEGFVENEYKTKDKWIIRGGPTDKAVLAAAVEKGSYPVELKKQFETLDELPFDNKVKFLAGLYKNKETKEKLLFVSGAPEKLIGMSGLTKTEKEKWEKDLEKLASQGYRTIAIAYKKTLKNKINSAGLNNLQPLAILGLSDPIRKEVKQALDTCRSAGIRIIIVTGDHKLTAKAVGQKLGFKTNKENIMEGREIDELSDEQFKKVLDKIHIFARVEPEHKLRIVNAWQEAGEVVAMTGDGINDAPALKKADIGVAIGSGTEVAKETSDLILLNDSFSIIASAVEQGRAILDNIRKVITYLLSDSFTEILLIGGSIFIAKILAKPWFLPLTAIQILWVNLAEDGLPSQALAFEPKEKDLMKQKPTGHKISLLTKEMKVIIFAIGLITDLMLLGLLYWFMSRDLEITYIRTMIFSALAIDSLFYIFACRSLKKGILYINPFSNKFLIIAWLFGVVALGTAIYLPFLNSLLDTMPLSLSDWAILASLGIANLFLIEIVKHYFIVRHQTEK